MAEWTGWRYGVDGLPYVAGLSAGSVTAGAGAAGVALRRRRRRGSRGSAWGGPDASTTVLTALLLVSAVTGMPAALGWRYVLRGKLAVRDRVLNAVAWRGNETVVDLGSGRGLLAIGAAARTAGVVHCVDLFVSKDLSGNTPQRLMVNARRAGVDDRVAVHRCDVRETGLGSGSVDVVVSTLCLHNVDGGSVGRRRAVQEVVRIVRPSGTVVITDLAHVDDEYATVLRDAGYRVQRLGGVRGSFPRQRMLVATAPSLPRR